jgi:hypothetical protein
MSCYLRVPSSGEYGEYLEPWKIEADVAVRIGVTNPAQGAGTYFKADPGETIWEAIRRQTPWFAPDGQNPFHRAGLQPGQYHPRIARPINFRRRDVPGWSPGACHDVDLIAIARSQLTVLTRQLNRICQTVHPTTQTFETFGHDIRNLLILACTEVEAYWRGVLTANGVKKDRYSTNDYVTLLGAMKLDEYAVTFPSYPWLDALQPYKGWGSTGNPTQELRWYDSYNAVKHNREAEFERGTLRHVFEAVSACVIMMAAQFGDDGIDRRSEVQSFFKLSAFPGWSPSDVYIEPCDGLSPEWLPVFFNFGIKKS